MLIGLGENAVPTPFGTRDETLTSFPLRQGFGGTRKLLVGFAGLTANLANWEMGNRGRTQKTHPPPLKLRRTWKGKCWDSGCGMRVWTTKAQRHEA